MLIFEFARILVIKNFEKNFLITWNPTSHKMPIHKVKIITLQTIESNIMCFFYVHFDFISTPISN